jgi:hypothetical protein
MVGRNLVMGGNNERWRELCAQAAVEQDPQKLMKLVREISRLLSLRARERDLQHHEDQAEQGPAGEDPPKSVGPSGRGC